MQRVSEQVDSAYLQQSTPRPMHITTILNLISDYVFEHPLKVFFDPVVVTSVIVLIGLFAMRTSSLLRLMPVLLILIRLAYGSLLIGLRLRDDLKLLRNGLIIRAHVLGLRPYRGTLGDISGAMIDCAIPVAPRRTYIGSIWLADGEEALRLAGQGRLEVLCLPRTPGTWRVIEPIKSDIRYNRMGPQQPIPQEA